MQTTKIDEHVENQQNQTGSTENKLNNFKESFKSIWVKKVVKCSFFSVLLVFLLIGFIRIPYVGVFIDSVFFSFLFGYAKYVLYIYFIMLIVQILINKKIKILFSKRFMLAIFLSTFFLSILFSGIQLLNVLSSGINTKIINEYLNYWYDTMFQSDPIFLFGRSGYLDGGIIGSCVGATSGFFLIIFALVAIFVIFLLLFKSWRNMFIQKTKIIKNKFKSDKPKEIILDGKSVVQDKLNFIEAKKDVNTNKIEIAQSSSNYLDLLYIKEKKQYNNECLDKSETNVNVHEIASVVQAFLKDNYINFEEGSIKPTPDTFEISILLTPQNLDNFKTISDKLKQKLNQYDYVIHYYETNVVLKFKTDNFILSERTNTIINAKIPQSLKYVLSLTKEMKPIYLNLQDNELIGVYSNMKQNTDNLIAAIVTSIAWNYNTKYIQAFFISPKNDKNIWTRLNIFHNIKQINKNSEIIDFLANLEKYCYDILAKLKENKINDIYSYNNNASNPKPNRIVIINDIDIIGQLLSESLSYLKRIIPMCQQCGVTIIMVDHSYDFISCNWFDFQTIATFKTTIEVSKKIVKSDFASNLDTYNHGLLIYKQKPITTFIANLISEEELNKIISATDKTYHKYDI